MKKILSIILAVCTCFSMLTTFTACKHKHKAKKWTVTIEATCTTEGKREKICKCGESLEEEIIAVSPDAHVKEWKVTKPVTCKEAGLKDEVCSCCGKVFQTGVVIPSSPDLHNFDILTNKCTACDKKEFPEITSFNQAECQEAKIVILLDYALTEYATITFDSATEYVRFVGTKGKTYNLAIKLATRETPITLDFVNAAICAKDKVTISAESNKLINIGLYGERSVIDGPNGEQGTDGGPFRDGSGGYTAISTPGDLHITIGATSCAIRGGNGGRGGNGSIGNDGGNGGNGAMAIYAEGSIKASCKEGYTKENLSVSGGSGGRGGEAGGWFFGTPVAGASGASAKATNVEIYYE